MSYATGISPVVYSETSGEKEKPPPMKLREPRDLYSTTSLQHPPKWPIECQVIPEKIRHIETVPAKLEPFYIPTSSEPQPRPVGEEMGTVLYDYQPKLSVDYFCRSCVGGSETLETYETEPNSLLFESRFESGNLAKAIKVTSVYYELQLRPDLYTDRHSQWFYFRIQNTKDNLMYRFSIVNFKKPDSLYKHGLKILMYSEKEAQLNKIGWVRCGQNIAYFKNDIPSSAEENGSLYTLTFNLKFKHNNDTIYLANCYPYTYTQLQNYLRCLEDDPFKSELLTVRLLCRSLAGNNVYVVTITSPDNYNEETLKKPAVVISARVHPGETQSSFMIKGIIDFLSSDCPQAKELRDRFIFKLIPMLNPDGVIVGNSRCCLLGQDLNRQYRTVLREAFPQIYQTKVLLRRLSETNGIFLYCDIHGHSRRNNVFIYGCENRKFPEKKLIEQVFPLMMHKNSTDKFSFQNCKFRVQNNKEGTARVFAWTLGVVNSFTLEISNGGSTMPSRPSTHFNTADYEATGRHFCETLLDFSDPSPEKELLREKILQKLTASGSNADEPVDVVVTDYSSISHSESEDNSVEETEKSKKSSTIQVPAPMIPEAPLRLSKKRPKLNVYSTVATITSKVEQRSVLSLNKAASVNSVRIGTRRPIPEEPPVDDITAQKELAVFKRLTKFRRKPRRRMEALHFQRGVIERESSTSYSAISGLKCSNILFDDPFNPPGASYRQDEPPDLDDESLNLYSGSGTEDECDEKDGAMKNKQFALSSDEANDKMVESMSQLRMSENALASSCNALDKIFSYIPPFIPKLPQSRSASNFSSVLTFKKSFEEPRFTDQKRRASLATTTVTSVSSKHPRHNSGPKKISIGKIEKAAQAPTTLTNTTTATTSSAVQKRAKYKSVAKVKKS